MIGDYPIQLDEIDQWLNDNFGILPGACSSTENLRYSVARRVAEALWPKTQTLPSDVNLDSKMTFDCVSKRVTMTVQELINYYIDRECCDVAEECGF